MKLTFKNDGSIIDAAGEYLGIWDKITKDTAVLYFASVRLRGLCDCYYYKAVFAHSLEELRKMLLEDLID